MKIGKMFLAILVLSSAFASFSTFAYDEIEIIPEESEREMPPRHSFQQRVNVKLNAIHQLVQHRRLRDALSITRQLEQDIAFEIRKGGGGGTAYGECYYDNRCTQRVSQSTPTKDMCKAAGGGSWKQTNPSTGPCVRI